MGIGMKEGLRIIRSTAKGGTLMQMGRLKKGFGRMIYLKNRYDFKYFDIDIIL